MIQSNFFLLDTNQLNAYVVQFFFLLNVVYGKEEKKGQNCEVCTTENKT